MIKWDPYNKQPPSQAPGQGFTPTFTLSSSDLRAKDGGSSLSASQHTTNGASKGSAEGKGNGQAAGECRRAGAVPSS